MINTKYILIAAALFTGAAFNSQAKEVFEITPQWLEKIEKIAPEKAMAKPKKDRKILIFSLITGYVHKVTPKTGAAVKILGKKTGAWKVVESNDIEEFAPEKIKQYDAVVLNNNCPGRKDRDIFRDVLVNQIDKYGVKYKEIPLEEREAKATELLDSLMKYVEAGGGLIALHGAIANFNNNDDFSALLGGSFNYHPAQQKVFLNPVNPDHPLTKCFKGSSFVHVDEPYLFNRAYEKMNFHPLLEMDTGKIKDKRLKSIQSLKRYTAWIKPHGKGRVFYCSPSHNPSSFDQPELLQFMLGGIQYALGDLECDDTPLCEE